MDYHLGLVNASGTGIDGMSITNSGTIKFLLIFSLVGSIINGQRVGALISLTILVLWYEWREYEQKNVQGKSQKDTED